MVGIAALMCYNTSLSMTTGVSATGLKSLRDVATVCFGTGMIVDILRQVGVMHFNRERLKVLVNVPPNSTSQSLRTHHSIFLEGSIKKERKKEKSIQ